VYGSNGRSYKMLVMFFFVISPRVLRGPDRANFSRSIPSAFYEKGLVSFGSLVAEN